ncbi:MAG: hypothetical protein FWG79_03445 [Bacteroidales bacterium]|nr:hypothetical protein [Bacteroidales bacterium]
MRSVHFLPEVREYLDELETILYEKGYFSYEENSHKYVDELVYDIKFRLPLCFHKPAPKYFEKYGEGMYYATFKKNRQTTWYVFFRMYRHNDETTYQVRYIANNHTVAQHL